MDTLIALYQSLYLSLASLLGSYGVATLALSLLASVLLYYPLVWAARVASQEQEFQDVIGGQITRIKQQSRGAEQHARIDALYRRYAYHPVYAVRKITGLFIQLPFLMLTFFMFDGLAALEGKGFLFLDDLGQPDQLLGGSGNLLPFVMILMNLSAALFVPNFSKKDLMQAVGVSLLFFILLYNAKSVLLLYWTMNNVILLVQNIFAYRQADRSARMDFSLLTRNLWLWLLQKQTAMFFMVFFVYASTIKLILDGGNNQQLADAMFVVLTGILVVIALVHLMALQQGRWSRAKRINGKRYQAYPRLRFADLVLILIPLAPICQYILMNQELLTATGQLLFLLIFVCCCFAAVIVAPLLLHRLLPIFGLVPLGLTLVFVYVSMPAFSLMGAWAAAPDLALLAALIIIAYTLLDRFYRHQRTFLYSTALVYFVISTSYTAYDVFTREQPRENVETTTADDDTYPNFIATGQMKKKPDIYLLTYDAYVGQETMQQYGIDNSAQERFLTDAGFKIYPETYSVGFDSINSMSRMLEVSHQLTKMPRDTVMGRALVPVKLKEQGYKTHAVLKPYFVVNALGSITYDHVYPQMKDRSLLGLYSMLRGMREGQFRFDVVGAVVDYTQADWIAEKRKIFSQQTQYPKFLYTHTGPGHSQNSGQCLPNETELFEERLFKANLEMKEDIHTILASKRDAIIIVNGDHGPYLTDDCTLMKKLRSIDEISQQHIQDRSGTFLAIRWPGKGFEQHDDFVVLQDVFEGVFKYLYDTDRVLKQSPDTATIRFNKMVPSGMVVDGKIALGKDKGKPLFDGL